MVSAIRIPRVSLGPLQKRNTKRGRHVIHTRYQVRYKVHQQQNRYEVPGTRCGSATLYLVPVLLPVIFASCLVCITRLPRFVFCFCNGQGVHGGPDRWQHTTRSSLRVIENMYWYKSTGYPHVITAPLSTAVRTQWSLPIRAKNRPKKARQAK